MTYNRFVIAATRVAAITIYISGVPAWAEEAYLPDRDSAVLETLPATPFSRDQLATVREKIANEPDNIRLITAAANSYIKMGKSTGDPRYYGYARAALERWWKDENAPITITRYRAKLKEVDHNYDGAIADLQNVIKREPNNVQAWTDLANNYRVKGEYAKAWKAVKKLETFAETFQVDLSRTPLMAVNGSAAEAYDLLVKQLPVARMKFPDSVLWILIVRADLARIMGKHGLADQHYREALKHTPDEAYAKRVYGEFLLDRGQPKKALAMLAGGTGDNGVLLLMAIAARRGGTTDEACKLQSQLEDRYQELRLRGGEPHGRFEARFLLELKKDPQAALKLAVENWQKQKEARDSRNVLEAALEAGKPDSAREVINFLRKNKTEDVELIDLVTKIENLK